VLRSDAHKDVTHDTRIHTAAPSSPHNAPETASKIWRCAVPVVHARQQVVAVEGGVKSTARALRAAPSLALALHSCLWHPVLAVSTFGRGSLSNTKDFDSFSSEWREARRRRESKPWPSSASSSPSRIPPCQPSTANWQSASAESERERADSLPACCFAELFSSAAAAPSVIYCTHCQCRVLRTRCRSRVTF
jgi:hypothetical protein